MFAAYVILAAISMGSCGIAMAWAATGPAVLSGLGALLWLWLIIADLEQGENLMGGYWDYNNSSTSTTTTSDFWGGLGGLNNFGGTASTTYSNNRTQARPRYYTDNTLQGYTDCSASSGQLYNYYRAMPVIRYYLIEEPEHWDEAIAASFTRLLNDETDTGFTVLMRIKGDIQVADPNIEHRTMANFLPLLRRYARGPDLEKINAFFAKFGAEPPEPATEAP